MEKKEVRFDDLSNDEAMAILFCFFYQEERKRAVNLWTEFEKEIKYNSRFFPKADLLSEIQKLQRSAELIIPEGEIFYRARLFKDPFLGNSKKQKQEIIDVIIKHYPDMKGKDEIEICHFFEAMSPLSALDQTFWDDLKRIMCKKKRYWGYNCKDSDAPPCERASYGRANSNYISYLYLADDVKTAILEVRPHKDQDVSVATFKIVNDLKIYDLCSTHSGENAFEDIVVLDMLSALFSEPKYGEESDYLASQYLCEYIRNLGFDGIRFQSSLNPEAKNIVLFDIKENPLTKQKNYKILNSKVYSVNKLDVEYIQIAPNQ